MPSRSASVEPKNLLSGVPVKLESHSLPADVRAIVAAQFVFYLAPAVLAPSLYLQVKAADWCGSSSSASSTYSMVLTTCTVVSMVVPVPFAAWATHRGERAVYCSATAAAALAALLLLLTPESHGVGLVSLLVGWAILSAPISLRGVRAAYLVRHVVPDELSRVSQLATAAGLGGGVVGAALALTVTTLSFAAAAACAAAAHTITCLMLARWLPPHQRDDNRKATVTSVDSMHSVQSPTPELLVKPLVACQNAHLRQTWPLPQKAPAPGLPWPAQRATLSSVLNVKALLASLTLGIQAEVDLRLRSTRTNQCSAGLLEAGGQPTDRCEKCAEALDAHELLRGASLCDGCWARFRRYRRRLLFGFCSVAALLELSLNAGVIATFQPLAVEHFGWCADKIATANLLSAAVLTAVSLTSAQLRLPERPQAAAAACLYLGAVLVVAWPPLVQWRLVVGYALGLGAQVLFLSPLTAAFTRLIGRQRASNGVMMVLCLAPLVGAAAGTSLAPLAVELAGTAAFLLVAAPAALAVALLLVGWAFAKRIVFAPRVRVSGDAF